jgi:hypothetical protein
VRDARYTLFAAVQRISANSTNSIKKLSNSSRSRPADVVLAGGRSVLAAGVASPGVTIGSAAMCVRRVCGEIS